jgi:hypothetical protein
MKALCAVSQDGLYPSERLYLSDMVLRTVTHDRLYLSERLYLSLSLDMGCTHHGGCTSSLERWAVPIERLYLSDMVLRTEIHDVGSLVAPLVLLLFSQIVASLLGPEGPKGKMT